jgi:hypothetical protein
MKRTKTTESPLVTIKIPLETFIRLAETGFQTRLGKLNLDARQTKQVIGAFQASISEILVSKFSSEGTVQLVQFPLGSESASGKFNDPDAGDIVYVPGTGKHKPYIRKWVTPKNTITEKRTEHRNLFKQVNQQWKDESPAIKSSWELAAKQVPPYSGQNLYVKRWFEVGKETGEYPGVGFKP